MDGLERDLAGHLHVISLDIHDPVGRQVGSLFGLEFTPSYVLLDGEGHEIWRKVGVLRADEVTGRLRP